MAGCGLKFCTQLQLLWFGFDKTEAVHRNQKARISIKLIKSVFSKVQVAGLFSKVKELLQTQYILDKKQFLQAYTAIWNYNYTFRRPNICVLLQGWLCSTVSHVFTLMKSRSEDAYKFNYFKVYKNYRCVSHLRCCSQSAEIDYSTAPGPAASTTD